ncbi:MAG: PEGA domain-containing protein [Ignavibacteriaceae bacterium]|nr:PEGA domain-containing protein [Ignavibacteriaceae bacterium]
MKKYFNHSFILILVVFLSVFIGCATLFQHGPDRIPVKSYPINGAKIYLDDKFVGLTPSIVIVPRKSECVIRVEMTGYEPIVIDRDKNLNGWFLGNILIGGLVGITIDLITHNQGGYSEEPIMVELKAKTTNGDTETKVVWMKPVTETH